MIPVLFNYDEAEFTSNGVGRLKDCVSCVVTEERNGIYECDFEYPITGQNYDKIKVGMIVGVEHDNSGDIQPFDIVSTTKPIGGVVGFHAVHISYRQTKLVASGTNIVGIDNAIAMIRASSPANPFWYTTDIVSSAALGCADGVPRSVRQILGGVEGSMLDTYGGEYEWDKWTVRLKYQRGVARDFTIRYGLNMIDYNEETDYSNSYSAVVPYWTGTDGNDERIVVKGSMVEAGSVYAGRREAVAVDFTEDFETQPTTSQLEALAQSHILGKQTYLPTRTIRVSFIRLQDTTEYAQYSALLECKLCDTINVVFPQYEMRGAFKIVKTVYNVLKDRFDSMELGTLSTTLSEALGVGASSGGGYSSGGGGGISYSISASGNVITLTGSNGSTSTATVSGFVTDNSYVHTDNNFTTELKDKLNGIASGAEVNVQSDWNEADSSKDDFIKNKPSIPSKVSDLTNDSDFVSDASYVHTDNNFLTELKNKLVALVQGVIDVKVNGTSVVANNEADIPVFTGATSAQNGTAGVVPAPASQGGSSAEEGWFLASSGAFRKLSFSSIGSGTQQKYQLMSVLGNSQIKIAELILSTAGNVAGLMSAADKTKLDGIEAGAEANVQSDWSQSDSTADDYIKNKPTIPTVHNVPSGGSAGQVLSKASATDYDLEWATPDASDIFWAVYGTTTNAEIEAAYQAGKQVFCKYDSKVYSLAYRSTEGTTHVLTSLYGLGSRCLTITANAWTYNNYVLVPNDRTVNGKPLSGNVVLDASDVGAVSDVTLDGASVVNNGVAELSSTGLSHGVPSGGSSGQVLSKASGTDYDVEWITPSGGSAKIFYGRCTTSSTTAAKTASIPDFTSADLVEGVSVTIRFTNTNAVASPSLNVSGTGAIPIKIYGTTAPGAHKYNSWFAGEVVTFTYDGTNWLMKDFAYKTPALNSTTYQVLRAASNSTEPTWGKVTNAFLGTASATPTASYVAIFDSSKHMNSEDMAEQDVSDFVDSLEPSASGVADYVIEQGTDGIWTYRKWNSGVSECWGANTYSLTHYATVGTFYGYYTSVTFPTGLFIARPTFLYNTTVSNNFAWAGPVLGLTETGSNVYAIATSSGTQSVSFDMRAKGRWK